MDTEVMLTTFDNPYDPFEEFVPWLLYDSEMGYNTCGKLARIARFNEDLSTVEEDEDRVRAIDEIIDHDDLNIYTKAFPKVSKEETVEEEQ